MLRRIKLTLACSAISLAAIADMPDGAWSGVLNVGEAKLPIVFHFQKNDSDSIECLMDSPAPRRALH